MPNATQCLDSFVALLTYPDEYYLARASEARQEMSAVSPEVSEHVIRFFEGVRGMSTEGLQELFTRTFDLNPACVLEVGWQLFGDEYKRGEFLVRMRQLLAEHGAPASKELPDHLPRVLDLLPRLEHDEANELTAHFVLPALAKMLAGLEGKGNPYEALLKAVQAALAACYASATEEVNHG